MKKTIILLFVLTGLLYSQGLTGHYSSLLKKRVATVTDTLGVNLLNNPEFENAFNEETDWGSAFGATVERSTEQVYAGTYSAKVITAGGGTGIIHLYIPVVIDSIYWVEGYYYIVDGNANVSATTPLGNINLETKDAWTYFSFSITATSTTEIYFRLTENGAGGNTTFYLDNVSIRRRLP